MDAMTKGRFEMKTKDMTDAMGWFRGLSKEAQHKLILKIGSRDTAKIVKYYIDNIR